MKCHPGVVRHCDNAARALWIGASLAINLPTPVRRVSPLRSTSSLGKLGAGRSRPPRLNVNRARCLLSPIARYVVTAVVATTQGRATADPAASAAHLNPMCPVEESGVLCVRPEER